MRNNLAQILTHVFGSEGGFSLDRKDTGNWTGGAEGSGQLKGTKFGISAAAYPKLDIKNLSLVEAAQIYEKDYWGAVKGNDLPSGLDLVAFDAAVNSGVSRSAKWLQKAVGVAQDGKIGPVTIAAAHSVDRVEAINKALDLRHAAMKTFKTWPIHGKGWTTRIANVRAEALRMARDDPAPSEVVHVQPATAVVIPTQQVVSQSFTITVTGAGPFEVKVTPVESV